MKATDKSKMKKSRTKGKKGATDAVEQEGVLVRSKKVAPLELVEVGTAEVDITKPDIVAATRLGELGAFPILVCRSSGASKIMHSWICECHCFQGFPSLTPSRTLSSCLNWQAMIVCEQRWLPVAERATMISLLPCSLLPPSLGWSCEGQACSCWAGRGTPRDHWARRSVSWTQ